MTTEEKLKKYQDWLFKCSAYHMALNIIDIDKHNKKRFQKRNSTEKSDSRKKEEKEKKIQGKGSGGKGRANPHGPSFLVQAVEKGSATDDACGIKKENKNIMEYFHCLPFLRDQKIGFFLNSFFLALKIYTKK